MEKVTKSLGTWHVMVSGVALVVAASTLVSDFTGFFTLGAGFVIALLIGFIINLLLALSASNLSVAYPKAGALYDYARNIFKGSRGRLAGVVLGLAFFSMFAFAVSGETAAGAHGMQALLYSEWNIGYFIVILMVLAVIPNLLGLKTTAWVSAGLLLFMLGIRWFFGLAGFFGWGQSTAWSLQNLTTSGINPLNFTGENGILTAGLALAFWSFVGIEFACSLAEEVKSPRKSIPKGLILGLVFILITSLTMGLGVTGIQPLAFWQEAINGPLGNYGEAPQLAVGSVLFGKAGYLLMAMASVSATLGTLTVAFAAMPRIIYSIARDGLFFGPLSGFFAKLHPRLKTPVNATLLTLAVYLLPSLYSSAVVEWLYSAAYVWTALYVVFHILSLVNSRLNGNGGAASQWAAVLGIVATIIGLYYAFAGEHGHYGLRALAVLLVCLSVAYFSLAFSYRAPGRSRLRLTDDVEKAA